MKNVSILLESRVKEYIATRLATKLDTFDKDAEKSRKKTPTEELGQLEEQLLYDRIKLQERYEIRAWLTAAARRANQISMVTHAPKYTHSDTKSVGILVRADEADKKCSYLCSASLANLSIDVVGNAAALDVASLLLLNAEGKTLLDEISNGESLTLAAIAESKDQLEEWLEGFSKALSGKELTSGQLSKQLYFPLNDGGYHLISPLYASAIGQSLYEKMTDSFYSEQAKNARKAKKSQKFDSTIVLSYPNIAKQSFGGTKPQNISQLNTNRYGQGFLLSCQPPHWQKQVTPPLKSKSSFWQEYDRRAWKTAKYLQKYLKNIFSQSSTMVRREFRAELVDELIGKLLSYAAEVQNLKQHAGWSIDSKLSKAEQLWLDPHRCADDAEFKAERDKNDWQTEIAKQFAAWLNHKISHKSDTLYTDDDTFNYWKKILERKLSLLKEDLEVMV